MKNNATRGQTRRILVIDDNAAIHGDFKKILAPVAGGQGDWEALEAKFYGESKPLVEAPAFQVDTALQGEAGFALVQQAVAAGQPYAMAFIDVRMPPGWDGIETTSRIWEIDPDLQVVICTAYSDYSWEQMIAKLGISHQLTILKKPFDAVEVLQLAHALSEKWELQKRNRARMEQLEEMVSARTRELEAANERLKAEMAERGKTEAALRQAQKMESLGQLAGGIAHDFNNLLTVIRGYVQLLQLRALDRQTHEELGEIDAAASRAAKLTAQLLMFSRKKRLQPEFLDLNQIISHVTSMLGRILGEDIALEIRGSGAPLEVRADPAMIEQVILNLAINARDAMPQGGRLTVRAGEIEIKPGQARNAGARPGRFACLAIEDTGCGIAPEAVPHLFEPFFTTKEPGKGTGLGLATAYGIISQHSGWIEVETEPGRGTAMKVFLPIQAGGAAPAAVSQPKPANVDGRETILLVEDEEKVRRLARTAIQRHGYRVFEAGSGAEALSVWNEHSAEIDLLLTDMIMPGGLSGRELAEKLLQAKHDLKVIYTTGYSLDAINHNLSLTDGLNFLPKPYYSDKLVQTVRRCLDEPAVA